MSELYKKPLSPASSEVVLAQSEVPIEANGDVLTSALPIASSEVESETRRLQRRSKIQLRLMKYFGYPLNHSDASDKKVLFENFKMATDWEEDGMAEIFQKGWKILDDQQLVDTLSDDEIIQKILDVFSGMTFQTPEIRAIKRALWPLVENKIKQELSIDDTQVLSFSPQEEKWHQKFNTYLESPEFQSLLKKGYTENQITTIVAKYILFQMKTDSFDPL